MGPRDVPDAEDAYQGTVGAVGSRSRTVPWSYPEACAPECGRGMGVERLVQKGSPAFSTHHTPRTASHTLSAGSFPTSGPGLGPGGCAESRQAATPQVLGAHHPLAAEPTWQSGPASTIRGWGARDIPGALSSAQRAACLAPQELCRLGSPTKPGLGAAGEAGPWRQGSLRHLHLPLGQLNPGALTDRKRNLQAELNYVYCTKKGKPSKTSPRMVCQTAAKGSVDKVNKGLSTSSKQSLCDWVQSPKKGVPLTQARQNRCGLPCLTLLKPGLIGDPQRTGRGPHPASWTRSTEESQSPGLGREDEVELSTSVTGGYVAKRAAGGSQASCSGQADGVSRSSSGSTAGSVPAASRRDVSDRF